MAAPKSISLTSLYLVMMMLSGEISRCMSPKLCTSISESMTGRIMPSISSVVILPPLRCIYFLSEIPSKNSMTMYAVPFAEKKSRTFTMPERFFIFARFLASSINRFKPRFEAD